jgi:hypothetical protein
MQSIQEFSSRIHITLPFPGSRALFVKVGSGFLDGVEEDPIALHGPVLHTGMLNDGVAVILEGFLIVGIVDAISHGFLLSVHPEMANLPDIGVVRKILSSEYHPYACGKIFRTP